MHRFIKINQEGWLEPYINMDEELRKAKNDFEKGFFKLKDNAILEKPWKMWEKIDITSL